MRKTLFAISFVLSASAASAGPPAPSPAPPSAPTSVNPAVTAIATTPAVLPFAATVTPAFAATNFYTLALAGNATLANPTGAIPGQSGCIRIIQDGAGNRTLSWGSAWKWPGGAAPTLSTAPNAVDDVCFWVFSASEIHGSFLGSVQ